MTLFWRDGYRSTTTRDLEAGLGVTQSSLYNAFGSKAGLLDAVLDRYETAVDHTLLQPLRRAPDGASGLRSFFRDLGAWMTVDARGCLMVNLMVDEAATDPAIAERTRAHRNRVRAALREAAGRAWPAVTPRVLDHRADLLLGVTLGLNVASRAGASAAELRRIVTGVQEEIRSWSDGAT